MGSLWNVFYDEVLKVEVLQRVKMIAYADDLAIVVEDRTEEEIQKRNGLTVAKKKAEAVVLVNKNEGRSLL